MEELESRQQEKIAQMTKMVRNLTKGKGITNDPGLQRKPISWKGCTNPSIEPNSDDLCEQGRLRKDSLRRPEHINVQQSCNFLDKKLKEIKV